MFATKQHWNNSFIYVLFIYLYVCMQSSDNTTTPLAKIWLEGRKGVLKYRLHILTLKQTQKRSIY